MKVIDVVKPPTNDRYEDWCRWLNRIETDLRMLSHWNKTVIEVKEG